MNWQRKRTLGLRDVFDAILFVTKTGIQWRNLSETTFLDCQAGYHYFDKWKKAGTIGKIDMSLNELERLQNNREANPSLGLVDSQSIKLAPMLSEQRGLSKAISAFSASYNFKIHPNSIRHY